MPDPDAPVVVVVPGDLHLTEPELENVRVAHWVVDEINDLVRPDFVQFIGDNVQDATEAQWRLFGEIHGRLKVPHFALVGDHDVKGDRAATGFQRHVGPTFGAMSLRGFRFIRLNTQESKPLGLSPAQIAWFRDDVETARARGERVVVFQHNYPYQIWEDFRGPGIDDWRAIVQTRHIEAIVCGHTHYWQVANDGRNVCVATRSVGDPEGGPAGYTLLYARGADLAVRYRSIAERGPIVLVTNPRESLLATGPAHVVRGADRMVARVWSERPVANVRCRVDGGAWVELEPAADGHWTGPLAGDRLAKGEHTLEVSALSVDGDEAAHEIEFLIDPTGRHTAVPEARPKVSTTSFC